MQAAQTRREAMEAGLRGEATARQAEILAFVRRRHREDGASPTVREIGLAMGISSPNGVMCHLKALTKKGFLRKREFGLSRGWVPTNVDLPRCPCCNQPIPESDPQPTE